MHLHHICFEEVQYDHSLFNVYVSLNNLQSGCIREVYNTEGHGLDCVILSHANCHLVQALASLREFVDVMMSMNQHRNVTATSARFEL